jgi:hypothetical protein
MVHPLDGVQAKLDRAFEHGKALREEIRSLDQNEFYETFQNPRPKLGADGVFWLDGYLRVLKEPPLKLGIIAGDCAHNLRGSLDHLVYQMAILDSRKSRAKPQGTFFPIARNDREYRVAKSDEAPCLRDRALAGIIEEHRAFVDAEQPYAPTAPPGPFEGHPLLALSSFSNTDKHRVIHAAVLRPVRVESFPLGEDFPIEVRLPRKQPNIIGDGAHIYSLGVRPTKPDMNMQTNLVYGLGFGNRGLMDNDLLNICLYVAKLIDRFRPLFP